MWLKAKKITFGWAYLWHHSCQPIASNDTNRLLQLHWASLSSFRQASHSHKAAKPFEYKASISAQLKLLGQQNRLGLKMYKGMPIVFNLPMDLMKACSCKGSDQWRFQISGRECDCFALEKCRNYGILFFLWLAFRSTTAGSGPDSECRKEKRSAKRWAQKFARLVLGKKPRPEEADEVRMISFDYFSKVVTENTLVTDLHRHCKGLPDAARLADQLMFVDTKKLNASVVTSESCFFKDYPSILRWFRNMILLDCTSTVV